MRMPFKNKIKILRVSQLFRRFRSKVQFSVVDLAGKLWYV